MIRLKNREKVVGRPRKLSDEDIIQIAMMYNRDASFREIAQEFNVTVNTVKKYITRIKEGEFDHL